MTYRKRGGHGGARREPLLTAKEQAQLRREYRARASAAIEAINLAERRRRAKLVRNCAPYSAAALARLAKRRKRIPKAWHERVRKEVADLCSAMFGKPVTERMVDRIVYGG